MNRVLVLQAEAAECGLACLAMAAGHHGRRETLAELRRRFPISMSGSSLKSLVAMADGLGFSARPVRCELDELGQIETPAILHWSLDHYVVLRRIDRRHAWIADPARGERKLPLEEVSKHFTGVALELTPAPNFERRRSPEKVRLGDLWSRLSGFRPFLLQLFLLTLLLQAVGLISPLASQLVIDDVIGRADRDLLIAIVVGFGALAIVQTAIETLRGFIQLHAGQRMSIQLSGNLLKHLLRLPTDFFERRQVGDILSRFGSLGPVQGFLTGGLVGIVLDAAMVIPVAIIMVIYSPPLAALAVVNLIVIFVVRMAAFPAMRRFADENLNLAARTDSVFLETVRGARAIKLAGREAERHGLWQNAVAEQQNAAYRQGVFSLWGGAGLSVWQGLYGLVMLFTGALQVLDGNMTLGMYFAFQSYAGQFSSRVGSLIGAFFTFRMLGLHLERLADIVHADTERGLDGPATPAKPLAGGIEARDVRFRYGEHDPWVLRGAELSVRPGESVAIVGPSGGGKSTLLKLLIGLYEPTEGDILVDGHPMRALGLRAVRDRLGVVMQDDQLLSGTIADNVGFFDASIDMDKVERVCRLAHVHEDIMRTSMGYHSLIGDMGSVLSGGQKQRLLLARALYKDPAILFMDEGTANLDPELERQVMTSLASLNITRVMVAHREAAVRGADRVLLVDRGVVTEVTGATLAPFNVAATSEADA
ncbi:MAG: peptidase domain-containing ABC transporter [Brevundimonas diminuta]|nr:peptidase domain-containing ABC transporter [Brevundimonas diminuta]